MSEPEKKSTSDQKPGNGAKFLTGNLMRHITVMSLTASAGTVSIFLVDFADLYFISLLGQKELAAAVGFAGTLLYVNMSAMIGLMIAMSALASRQVGKGNLVEARRIATSVVAVSLGLGIALALGFWVYAEDMLRGIGASDQTLALATRYVRIVVPSLPIAALAMVGSGLLRAHGDARRAMNAILFAGIINAVLDPILIFGVGLGLDGAAFASVAARITMAITAIYPIIRHYGGFAPFNGAQFIRDLRPIFAIAIPAILTNVATPIGAIIVTRAIAPYGDETVAAFAVISRLTPLAFCVVYSLSGAIGPIVGQNFGGESYDRVRATLRQSLYFAGAYVVAMWALLFALNGWITNIFGLMTTGGSLIFWFAVIVAPLFFFNGALFISNATFNNLNRPVWSTLLNWGKNTVGTAPFVFAGSAVAGAPGVIIGQAIGGIGFAVLGVFLAFRLINAYEAGVINVKDDSDGPTPNRSDVPIMRQRV